MKPAKERIPILKFDISRQYKGTGVSQGLDRGLLVYDDDILLLEEGMGLGACAYQKGGFTYFTSIKSIVKEGVSFKVIYSIDRRLDWMILGIKSYPLTRALEYIGTNLYMKNEKRQEILLKLGGFLRKVFNVKPCFIIVPVQGEIKIHYELRDMEILVDLSCETEEMGNKLFVMNELGGNIFDQGIIDDERSIPPSGWQRIAGTCELYSLDHALAFTMIEHEVPVNIHSTRFWGREMVINNYCWAGFESEIVCDSEKFENYRYSIKFRNVVK